MADYNIVLATHGALHTSRGRVACPLHTSRGHVACPLLTSLGHVACPLHLTRPVVTRGRYGALDKCMTALPTISWRRVVLDEMQEVRSSTTELAISHVACPPHPASRGDTWQVRSSTTELAKKCERLHAPRRWMVSGTPLYDKISDLQVRHISPRSPLISPR